MLTHDTKKLQTFAYCNVCLSVCLYPQNNKPRKPKRITIKFDIEEVLLKPVNSFQIWLRTGKNIYGFSHEVLRRFLRAKVSWWGIRGRETAAGELPNYIRRAKFKHRRRRRVKLRVHFLISFIINFTEQNSHRQPLLWSKKIPTFVKRVKFHSSSWISYVTL